MECTNMGRGCFRWLIYDPFLKGRNLKATFYLGSPTITQWKVTIRPQDRLCIRYWTVSFSLEYDRRFDSQNEIKIVRLLTLIKLNGTKISSKIMDNCIFNEDNEFACNFDSIATVHPQTKPHVLEVRIEISLPGGAIQNEIRNGLFSNKSCLEFLSEDLELLLNNAKYPNMNLLSSSDCDPIKVHSYILKARWDNFFQFHKFEIGTHDTVQTEISRAVLNDILTYMYTGKTNEEWPDWEDVEYVAEQFQVIEKYKLYHLYKVFAKTDLQQLQVTKNPVLIESRLFPVDIINNRLINNNPHTWNINPNTEYEFIFQIQLRNDRSHPLLSYSLQSRSQSQVYVEINLEVTKKGKGNDLKRVWHFHAENYTVDPLGTVSCKSVNFHGFPDTLEDFDTVSSDGKFFIQCFFNVRNGDTVVRVQCEHDNTLQCPNTRFDILSKHLYKLYGEEEDTDMVLVGWEGTDLVAHPTHKGILAVRLPGVGDYCLPDDIPKTLKTHLNSTSISILLEYMYTGKIFSLPFEDLDKIEKFAKKIKFYSIEILIQDIRAYYTN